MCGIFGFSAKTSITRKQRLQLQSALCLLGVANDERGGHSFGAYLPRRAELLRGIGRITGKLSWARIAAQSCAFAHTRYATMGTISKPNSHPFALGDIVGAHNGMVRNWREYGDAHGMAYPVDSQYLLSAIERELPTDDMSAYGAVEYCRAADPEAIKLCRFNSGELAIASTPMGVIWSSDENDLWAALDSSGIDGTSCDVAPDVVYSAESGKLSKTESRHKFATYIGASWRDSYAQDADGPFGYEEEDYAQWSARMDRELDEGRLWR